MRVELTPDIILEAVANKTETAIGDVMGRVGRKSVDNVAKAKQIAAYLFKKHLSLPYLEIAQRLGFSSKVWTAYSIECAVNQYGNDWEFRILVTEIELAMFKSAYVNAYMPQQNEVRRVNIWPSDTLEFPGD